ncbi:beta-ketoacyl-ACP synthase III [Streptomyces sp. NPDC001941]|uniref:beta-ketoacyl-ACP synthase III n=1 Tax=Streptomyces sp. NPDC001941 TaxID=3154659 RepID=UPI00331BC387
MTSHAAVLCGVGGHLPPDVVTNDALPAALGVSDAWVRTRTGITRRHAAAPGTTTSDLAAVALRRALESAGDDRVDALIVATTTPDRRMPGTAPVVAAKLGLPHIPAHDVSAVCTGFVYALGSAVAAVVAGHARRVAVVGAETLTTVVDPGDRNTTVLFGDGAGAVVVRAGDPEEPGAVKELELGSDGTLHDLVTIRTGGSERPLAAGPGDPDAFVRMDGSRVFTQAVRRMVEASERVLARTGWSAHDVDRLVPHQANVRIMNAVAERLGIPAERTVVHVDRAANTSAASIPLALADGLHRGALEAGQRLLVPAFGGGLTWGAVTLTCPDVTAAAPAAVRH